MELVPFTSSHVLIIQVASSLESQFDTILGKVALDSLETVDDNLKETKRFWESKVIISTRQKKVVE